MAPTLIIVGASTRAAATSALRAGWTPWCADLFADADLERIATVRKVPSEAYPQGLLDALAGAPPGPVLYTGALENRPDLVARIDRPLLGNRADVLRAVRNPTKWTACLHEHGLPCPAIARAPTPGRWLLKPRKSAAGFGIAPYAGQAFKPRTHYLQEWIDGVPCSGIFLGARLLGVTRQLIGAAWLNAVGFHYAGNIGPLPMDDDSASRWQALGDALANGFRLRGLFGVDAIVRDGVVWPIEINPRYTASMELLERAYRMALLPWHGAAVWGDGFTLPPGPSPGGRGEKFGGPSPGGRGEKFGGPSPGGRGEKCGGPSLGRIGERIHGKAILYARATIAFPTDGPWLDSLRDGADLDCVEFADVPHAGDIIERGRPVLTLFAAAASADACAAALQEKAQALDRTLFG